MDQPAEIGAVAISRRRRCALAAGIVALIFLLVAVPLILIEYNVGRGYLDQRDFHHLVIQRFASQWPTPDFSDYESMTTPGYHLILAAGLRAFGDDIRLLRLIGSLFTVGLLMTLAAAVAARVSVKAAVALCLPVVCSLYVLSSGIWLLPDNAAWWGVLGVLLIVLRPKIDVWTYLIGGLALLLLVWMRQIHVWAAAVLWTAAWIPPADGAVSLDRSAVRRTTCMFLATLPAFLSVYGFYRLWDGFTVPMYQYLVVEPSWSAPAIILALFACFSPFFLGYLPTRFRSIERSALVAGLAAGALLGLLPATTIDPNLGRHTGIWNFVPFAPVLADRSMLIAALSTAGGGLAAVWFVALPPRDRWIFLVALLAFIAAQVPGGRAWQRYYEPMLLILLAIFAARMSPPARAGEPASWRLIGPIILAAGLAFVSFLSLTRASVI